MNDLTNAIRERIEEYELIQNVATGDAYADSIYYNCLEMVLKDLRGMVQADSTPATVLMSPVSVPERSLPRALYLVN